jgi:hypothetical protein
MSVAAVLIASTIMTVKTASAQGWTRGIDEGMKPADEFAFRPFVLAVVGGEGNHVHGLFNYFNLKPGRIEIEGTKARNGDFYPFVVGQVAHSLDNGWQTIGSSRSFGKTAVLTVEGKGVSKALMVDMDMFRPMIGKFRYGRLVLRSGETAVFELKDLLPPDSQ